MNATWSRTKPQHLGAYSTVLDRISDFWTAPASLAFVAILTLAGCNGTLPPAPKEVRIPVPVPCISREQIPAKDFITDKALGALPDFDLVIALRTDQLKQRIWIDTAAGLLEACVK